MATFSDCPGHMLHRWHETHENFDAVYECTVCGSRERVPFGCKPSGKCLRLIRINEQEQTNG